MPTKIEVISSASFIPLGYSLAGRGDWSFSRWTAALTPADCAPVTAWPSMAGGGAGLSSVGATSGTLSVLLDDMVKSVFFCEANNRKIDEVQQGSEKGVESRGRRAPRKIVGNCGRGGRCAEDAWADGRTVGVTSPALSQSGSFCDGKSRSQNAAITPSVPSQMPCYVGTWPKTRKIYQESHCLSVLRLRLQPKSPAQGPTFALKRSM